MTVVKESIMLFQSKLIFKWSDCENNRNKDTYTKEETEFLIYPPHYPVYLRIQFTFYFRFISVLHLSFIRRWIMCVKWLEFFFYWKWNFCFSTNIPTDQTNMTISQCCDELVNNYLMKEHDIKRTTGKCIEIMIKIFEIVRNIFQ